MHTTIRTKLCLLLLLLGSLLYAGSDYTTYDRGIGAQAGRLSGTGLSYHLRLNDVSAFQTTLGLFYESDEFYLSLDYALGVEYQHTFYSDSYADWFAADLYWFAGLNHSGSMYLADSSEYSTDFTPSFSFGGGFGVEPILFGHFSLPVSFGYGLFYTPSSVALYRQVSVSFLAQIGARYRF
jgi:hypothetical protein